MKNLIIAFVVCLLTIGLAAGVWTMVVTFRELEAGLRIEKDRAAAVSRELTERSRALDQTRSEATAARAQAELALRDAEEKSAAAETADDGRRKAEQARIVAEQASREALNRENLARPELAELRVRRERELNRMHQSLSKIAPTRRTASGWLSSWLTIPFTSISTAQPFDRRTTNSSAELQECFLRRTVTGYSSMDTLTTSGPTSTTSSCGFAAQPASPIT